MGEYENLFHQIRCSMHPLLRHFSQESLKDPAKYGQALDYWNLPVAFRRECEKRFDSTSIPGYFQWKGKCLFSFDSLSFSGSHAALLRNIFVPKENRGQRVCKEVLAQITGVAESTGTCILAVVHPFEIHGSSIGLKGAIEVLHGTGTGFAHVEDKEPQIAMNQRLRMAGFRNYDFRDSMSEHGSKSIPITNQWIFVPHSVDKLFLAGISDHFVNEIGNSIGTVGIST
jgi:hypothetical protein